jgi:hypothetical protein
MMTQISPVIAVASRLDETRNLPPEKLLHTLLEESLCTPSPHAEGAALTSVAQRIDAKPLQRAQIANHKSLRTEATPVRNEAKKKYKRSLGEIRQIRSRMKAAHKKELRKLRQEQRRLFPACKLRLRKLTAACTAAIEDGDARIAAEFRALREAQFRQGILAIEIAAIDNGVKGTYTPQRRERRSIVCVNPECKKVFTTVRENTRYCCPACKQNDYRIRHS